VKLQWGLKSSSIALQVAPPTNCIGQPHLSVLWVTVLWEKHHPSHVLVLLVLMLVLVVALI
jgi:hypothetical protein